jgi:hypothetical protein
LFKVGGQAGGFDLFRGFGEGNSAQLGFGDRIQVAILKQIRKNEREKARKKHKYFKISERHTKL